MVSMPCNRGSVLLPDLRCEHPPRSSSCPIVRDLLPHDLSGATADLPPNTGPAPRRSASATSGYPASLGHLQQEQGQIYASSESRRLFPGATAPSPPTCPAAGISTTPTTSAPRATGHRSRSQGTRSSSFFQRTTTGTLSSQSRPHRQDSAHAPPPSLHSGVYLPGYSSATLLINVPLSSLQTLLGLAPSRDFILSSRVPRIRSIFNQYLAMVNSNPTQPLPWLKLLCLPHLLFTDSQSLLPSTVMTNLLRDDWQQFTLGKGFRRHSPNPSPQSFQRRCAKLVETGNLSKAFQLATSTTVQTSLSAPQRIAYLRNQDGHQLHKNGC